jgi:hypothetical protein
MAKTYKGDDISQCLNNTHVVYIGDSIMREQFYSLTAYMTKLRTRDAVHGDQTYHIKENGMTIEMWWDPYLNTSRTIDLLEGRAKNKPSLLVMGSGIWYMRRTGANYLTEWKSAIDRIFDGAKKTSIADRIMMSPVEIVYYDLMIPERKETLTIDKITIMNNYLRERETNIRNPVTPIVVPFVWNEIVVTTTNQTEDGLHFKPPVTKAQAQLALNYRCNQQLEKSFPMVNTCCNTYPHPKWYQSAIFIFFLCTIPLGFLAIQSTSGKYS